MTGARRPARPSLPPMQASPDRRPSRRPFHASPAKESTPSTSTTVEPVPSTAGTKKKKKKKSAAADSSSTPPTVDTSSEWFTTPHVPSASASSARASSPTTSDWTINHDPNHGSDYYYNHKTGESSWERPADFVDSTESEATPTPTPTPKATPATTEGGRAGDFWCSADFVEHQNFR